METIPLNDSIKFVIEDCGYSNFHELIGFQITHAYKNRLVRKILRPSLIFANFFMKTKAKFSMKKNSSYRYSIFNFITNDVYTWKRRLFCPMVYGSRFVQS